MTAPWRLLSDLHPRDGAAQMGTDRALLASARTGAAPSLRLYRWSRPTLSFGRNQPAAGLYDEAAARARGIAFVRRPTGGQAVLHADELTYAVVAPIDVIGRPRAAYRRINSGLVAGLRRLGVAAEVARGGLEARSGSGTPWPAATGTHRPAPAHAPAVDWSRACFRDPAAGEVVAAGRKLVGSAQRCEGGVLLQHGSILISGSQAPAEELLLAAPHAPRPAGVTGWTTLEEELGARPALDALARAVVAGFEETLGTALAPAGLSVEESARENELRAQFASPDWTWRR